MPYNIYLLSTYIPPTNLFCLIVADAPVITQIHIFVQQAYPRILLFSVFSLLFYVHFTCNVIYDNQWRWF